MSILVALSSTGQGRRLWNFLPRFLPAYLILTFSGLTLWEPAKAVEISNPRASITSAPLSDHSTALEDGERGRFNSLPHNRTGIDFEHRYFSSTSAGDFGPDKGFWGGVCLGDYNGDGLADVYLTRPINGNRLYRNLGNFRFKDVTEHAGVGAEQKWANGATFVDIDNDGDLDLYVCEYFYPNRLHINQGNGKFIERASDFGLDFNGASIMAAFADYDLDGDLDVYLLTNGGTPYSRKMTTQQLGTSERTIREGKWRISEDLREQYDILERPDGQQLRIIAGQYDHLYRNNGDGTFTDVSSEAGISGNHLGLSVQWWDYNNDRLPDLYVANDFWGPDHIYRNNGDGTFTDIADTAVPYLPWYSMGSDAADINNDGLLDFMGSDMAGANHYKSKVAMGDMAKDAWFLDSAQPRQYMFNALYVNSGKNRFMEAAQLAGVANTDWTWTVRFSDLDCDGWVDLFITNGMTRDFFNSDLRIEAEKLGGSDTPAGREFWSKQPLKRDSNLAFRNLGDLRFAPVGPAWGLAKESVSFGAAVGDLDGDGDMDLVVNNFEDFASVYRNDIATGHRVMIRLIGTASNLDGIGATVRLEYAAGVQVRYMTLTRGYMAAGEPLVHFGLGNNENIDRLTVYWPSGHQQMFSSLATDRLYTIREPSGPAPLSLAPSSPTPTTIFIESPALKNSVHREQFYDDFKRQPLLPNKLSQLGPGLAWSDVDGDGDQDVYISGAAGAQGTLRINEGGGKFSWRYLDAPLSNVHREEMSPLFFDADSDGDQDLYIVSGGVECEPDDPLLRDWLYLNNGHGQFKRAANDTLPDVRDSGSIVTAGDFDRDGDLDLFVGGRSIPGQYPLSPRSRLLRNNGGRFTDVTNKVAPTLSSSGMVTSAVWSDADNDGWLDLLVTYEWGPLRLWRNQGGQLVEHTEVAGLTERLGWYNGIAAGDVDRDGDMDYVVTNFGLNTKYHQPTVNKPVLIYYGDYDGTGRKRIIEAEYEGDNLFPVRGKSCSTNAIPSLGEKFTSFHDFAIAPLKEIYTAQCLTESNRFETNSLESGVFINNGNAQFTFHPLPRLAQISPGFGVVLTEVDGDGQLDLYLVQNFFGPQRETGRLAGGVSLLLTGNGDGTFEPVWPNRSGLVVSGDAKGLAAVDINNDGWIDLAVTVNDAPTQVFENKGHPKNRTVTVRLQGLPGNPTAVGSRVTVHMDDQTTQTAEVHAASSYLSQSAAPLIFGMGPSAHIQTLSVRWPNGRESSFSPEAKQRQINIKQPKL